VLYVEDNPVNQLLMEGMLGTLDGVQLRMADHPEAGLAMAREWAPDLLLLDIQLPGMSGFELLRRLRAEAPTAAIPAVAVTANAMADDVRRARAAGFDQHLSKPLVLADLVAVVRSLLPQGGG
jgi:CheY-like chemotaxis protein